MIPLGLMQEGESAEIVGIRDATGVGSSGIPAHSGCRIEEMGLRTGKVVEVMSNEGSGAVLVRIDESRIAIGRGMAMKVMVRRS